MREYAMPLAQEALKTLSAKYNFTPTGPILVEIFPEARRLRRPHARPARHDWRTGACFGRVVSLDSPHARPPPAFSWQATLWHEMTHVITLQMSNQRIPRWLTEGISEYEETQARPDWGREMEIPFALALERGKTLKVADLNSGFTRPDTIALAYYEASLLVDHIVKTYGEPKLQALVKSYGEGLEGNDAIEKKIGVDGARTAGVVRQGARCPLRRHAGGASRHPRRNRRTRPSRAERHHVTSCCRTGASGELRSTAGVGPGPRCRRRSRRVRAAREGSHARAGRNRRRQPARGDGASRRAAR